MSRATPRLTASRAGSASDGARRGMPGCITRPALAVCGRSSIAQVISLVKGRHAKVGSHGAHRAGEVVLLDLDSGAPQRRLGHGHEQESAFALHIAHPSIRCVAGFRSYSGCFDIRLCEPGMHPMAHVMRTARAPARHRALLTHRRISAQVRSSDVLPGLWNAFNGAGIHSGATLRATAHRHREARRGVLLDTLLKTACHSRQRAVQ